MLPLADSVYQVRARPSAMVAAGAKHLATCLDSRCGKSSCCAPSSNALDGSQHAEVHLHSASAHASTGTRINSAGFGTSPAGSTKNSKASGAPGAQTLGCPEKPTVKSAVALP